MSVIFLEDDTMGLMTFNRLIGVQTSEFDAEYAYQYDGLRKSKMVNGVTTAHIWVGSQIVLDISDENILQYIRGINLIARDDGTDRNFYLFNAHGDVTALTDATGVITKSYHYDAFGNETNPDATDDNPFRYCGEYFDLSSGTYYLRARYYDPATSRMLTEDTYWGDIRDPLSLNLYTYCANNPILYIDPSGNSYALTWTGTMWWLTVVDGPLPVGDIIYVAGIGVCTVADNWGTISTVGPAAWDWTTNVAAPWVSNAASDAGNWISDNASKGWNWLKDQFGGSGSSNIDPNDFDKGFKTFSKLKKHLGSPGKGNEWHHNETYRGQISIN